MIATIAAAVLAAHPLGNFSVNHYDGLTVHPDRIENLAIIDSAEIPTLQHPPAGPVDQHARQACTRLRDSLRARVDGRALAWHLADTSFTYQPGAAGLRTSRLTCRLTAPLRIDRARTLTFANTHRSDTVGWREITAGGHGVRLSASTVPSASLSGRLRDYPTDLLSSPLDVRQATITIEPGSDRPGTSVSVPGVDLLTRYTSLLADRLNALIGADRLTVPLGLLALLLSLLLGAAHAALPGHGKTVMAAYLAGRRGRLRDAVIVAVTVTATHTAGVLALGVLITLTTSLAADVLIGWLGVASGLIIALIGATLLRTALRHRHGSRPPTSGPGHGDGHGHEHEHEHGHGHGHERRSGGMVALAAAGGLVPSPSALVVLLGAMALGRSAFGVMTVVCYGLGMAATLLAAALALRRLGGLTLTTRLRRLQPYTSTMTAALVLVVGTGVTVRALTALA